MVDLATAAAAIGKGILSGAGSQLFASAFGGRQPDFAAILKVAFDQFKKELIIFFKTELDEREFKEGLRHLKTAQRNIRHYNISPDTRKDLLDEITFDISDLVGRLERLDERAFAAYLIAISLEIAIIQERAKKFGKKELKISCHTLLEATQQYRELSKLLTNSNNSRFTTVSYNGVPAPGSGGEPSYWVIYYRFDGEIVNSMSLPADRFTEDSPEVSKKVNELRREHIAKEWSLIQKRLDPLKNLLKDLIDWTENEKIGCRKLISDNTNESN